jgi:hypothetical protein
MRLAILTLIYLCLTAVSTSASGRVVLKPNIPRAHREELVARLRAITGLSELGFETDGALRFDSNHSNHGSKSAREMLLQAITGTNVIVLEDASSRADVAFCRVVRGRWVRNESTKPPAYVVLIDFTDFHQLSGDAEACFTKSTTSLTIPKIQTTRRRSASVKITSTKCVSRLVYQCAPVTSLVALISKRTQTSTPGMCGFRLKDVTRLRYKPNVTGWSGMPCR